ncbi:MAG: hypothetical protein A2784_01815 [Candidatus Chisholmbacteria bacterium RIFCSPHIGHO2_01_FULL_48_12]|uniref:Uncharacterized protein n=3 Tax=Patescibacteria group TaxID=1783273 RepID=A0A1G1VR84_9BACT|nr:MAG: hypothetical protein A3F03_04925 [Candidatus Roizmanbacteria bacterium RIFCSPHIGHO2_12_FULL_41_11]OGY17915.1 MAG: hypothetical protein A2784_01815 [Candidatus Chisholmbacteria bacterium RIFCSPHIGHO2_01_FULL_48_12]OGZ40434.1 MAG: hypothetical protein A3I20_00925 [Candidatus Portnoybacteria bacterium RIFCSPLOWO2_02_FULL_40_15]
MSHIANELDIKTDLIRCVMASLSPQVFEDKNFKVFFGHALKNLNLIREKMGESKFGEVMLRIKKASDGQNPINKRREDLLTAAVLI